MIQSIARLRGVLGHYVSADDEEEQRRQMFIHTFQGSVAQHAAANVALRVSEQLVVDALRHGDPSASIDMTMVNPSSSSPPLAVEDRLLAGPQRKVPTLSTLLATQVLARRYPPTHP